MPGTRTLDKPLREALTISITSVGEFSVGTPVGLGQAAQYECAHPAIRGGGLSLAAGFTNIPVVSPVRSPLSM